jgi:hypothetical protein
MMQLLITRIEETKDGQELLREHARVQEMVVKWKDLLRFHHVRVKKIEMVDGASMCLEVPDGHKFLQNGFCHGNCQGSQFRIVVIAVDPERGSSYVASREWVYTALSRTQGFCFTVGPWEVLVSWCSRQAITGRNTFFKELIEERMLQGQDASGDDF